MPASLKEGGRGDGPGATLLAWLRTWTQELGPWQEPQWSPKLDEAPVANGAALGCLFSWIHAGFQQSSVAPATAGVVCPCIQDESGLHLGFGGGFVKSLLNRSFHLPAPQRYLAGPQTASDIPTKAVSACTFHSRKQRAVALEALSLPSSARSGQQAQNAVGQGQMDAHTQTPSQQEGMALPRSRPVLVSQQ